MFKLFLSFLKKNCFKIVFGFIFVIFLIMIFGCITNKVSNSNSVSLDSGYTKHYYYGTPSPVLYE